MHCFCSISVPPKLAPFAVNDDPLHLGDFFQLNCAVIHGDFPYNITWLFNEQPVNYLSGVSILMVGKRSSSLNIDSVSGQHAGNYSCIGSNTAGTAVISTSLSIRGLCVYWFIASSLVEMENFQNWLHHLHCTIHKSHSKLGIRIARQFDKVLLISTIWLWLWETFFSHDKWVNVSRQDVARNLFSHSIVIRLHSWNCGISRRCSDLPPQWEIAFYPTNSIQYHCNRFEFETLPHMMSIESSTELCRIIHVESWRKTLNIRVMYAARPLAENIEMCRPTVW